MPDIKYPEITKNTSTPINPPVNNYGYAWNMTTIVIAIVLSPSISGQYSVCDGCELVLIYISLIY
jgi:hypothetical protein